MFIYRGVLRLNKNGTELFRMDTLCMKYAVVSYNVLLLCLPSDNVEHELRRLSLINIPERRKPRKQAGLVCRGALQAVLRQVVSCAYLVRHKVYRTCSARILLLDQPCKLRFDEQGKTTVTTAHPEYR